MAYFYDRTETADKVTIRMKNRTIYFVIYFSLGMASIASIVLSNLYPVIICTISPVLVLVFLAFWWFSGVRKVNSEVKRAMRNGKVTVSGSRWSNSNPLTYEIRKALLEEKI